MNPVKRIAILTSGGDAQGMNASLRSLVRTALNKKIEVFAIYEGYVGMVLGGDYIRPLSWNAVGGILHQGGTIIGSSRCEDFRSRAGRLKAAKNLLENDIDALVVIGGDGSLTGASTVSSTGQGWVTISSLNTQGVAHALIPGTSNVRAVLMQPAATSSFNVVGSITGEASHWDKKLDGVAAGYGNGTYPSTWTYLGHAMLRLPSQEVEFFRCWTVNSQVAIGGRLAVSLTAPGVVPGLYTIQRVRIAGFDEGETRPAIYEVEAGPQPRYRIDSLL